MSENIGEKLGDNIVEVLDRHLAELIPDDADEDEKGQMILQVLTKMDELANLTEDQKGLFETWLSGSEEERREALDQQNDNLEVLNRIADALNKKPEEDEGDQAAKGIFGLLAAGKILDALKLFGKKFFGLLGTLFLPILAYFKNLGPRIAVFLKRSLPKMLLRVATLPITIVGALLSGISDSIDEWRKSGDIKSTIIAGLAGILNFMPCIWLILIIKKHFSHAFWHKFFQCVYAENI